MNLERVGVVPRRHVRSLFRDQRTENHLVRLEIDAMQSANGHFKRSPPCTTLTRLPVQRSTTSVSLPLLSCHNRTAHPASFDRPRILSSAPRVTAASSDAGGRKHSGQRPATPTGGEYCAPTSKRSRR